MHKIGNRLRILSVLRFNLGFVLLAIASVTLASAGGSADESAARWPYTGVKAYFVGWDVRTRVPMTAEDVVRSHTIFFEIRDAALASNFVEWLDLGALRLRDTHEPGNARLVIELQERGGGTSLYYADRDHLYSGDSSRWREIGSDFRARFDVARREG